jgi:hypothetical protein
VTIPTFDSSAPVAPTAEAPPAPRTRLHLRGAPPRPVPAPAGSPRLKSARPASASADPDTDEKSSAYMMRPRPSAGPHIGDGPQPAARAPLTLPAKTMRARPSEASPGPIARPSRFGRIPCPLFPLWGPASGPRWSYRQRRCAREPRRTGAPIPAPAGRIGKDDARGSLGAPAELSAAVLE